MEKGTMKSFVWGMPVGAIVLLIFIFSVGWVVTSGSARDTAEEMVEKTLIDHLTPIAITQFLQDPNKEENFKDLEKIDSWTRDDFIEKGGWATMPGSESPVRGIADECARRLMKLRLNQ